MLYFETTASSSRFSLSTFTPASPRMPCEGLAVHFSTITETCATGRLCHTKNSEGWSAVGKACAFSLLTMHAPVGVPVSRDEDADFSRGLEEIVCDLFEGNKSQLVATIAREHL